MTRLFTLEQAQSLVPEVQRLLKDAVEARTGLEETQQEIASTMKRAHQMGGMDLDTRRLTTLRSRVGELANTLKSILQQFEDMGIQVKDLNIGLVDFPTKRQSTAARSC